MPLLVVGSVTYVPGLYSGGGERVLALLERMCNTFKLKKVADGVPAAGKPSEGVLKECEELGRKLAQAAAQ